MLERRILFIDNNPDFLDTRAEYLERAGYRVLKAYTLEQARQLLNDVHVHLAIVDIRMVDDDDDHDTSGLTLVRDPDFGQLPKIVLTGFPTYQAVLDAMRPKADSPPATDFLAKVDGPEAMIQAIEQALAEYVRANWDLDVQWDQRNRLSFVYLTSLLQPDLSSAILAQRANEFEDLLCRLFHKYGRLRIDRLLWHDKTRLCLPVLALSTQGATDRRLLVCGTREQLSKEISKVREFAPDTPRSTKLDSTAETMHFGAATYMLPDADIETVHVLRDVYNDGKESPLRRTLKHLLQEVLVAWHRRGEALDATLDLVSIYRRWVGLEGYTRRWVEQRVDALFQGIRSIRSVEVERDSDNVTFFFPNHDPLVCPDPVISVYGLRAEHDVPTVCRISPGQLSSDNVLVDSNYRTWLTDFSRADQAPQWWDFVCLEAVIRFDLTQSPDLLAWLEFEECLVSPASLSERLRAQDVISGLRMSVTLIEQIRRQAGSETGVNPKPYYAGLLAWAVGAMICYNPSMLYTQEERMHSAHLFLAASMIAKRLGEPVLSVPLKGVLRLDDEGAVWIGEHKVSDLGGQELALLRCLSEAKGQVLSRQAIMKDVFHESYSRSPDQESRINSLVRRLREKVEPNPSQARYIRTVRRKGYRLSVDG